MATIKSIVNGMLSDPTRPQAEKRVICEVMDAVIASHRNPVTEGFFYLDLQENKEAIDKWEQAGRPVVTKDNIHKFVTDPYRREYY